MNSKRLPLTEKKVPIKSTALLTNKSSEFNRRYNIKEVDKIAWVNEWLLKHEKFLALGNVSYDALIEYNLKTGRIKRSRFNGIYMSFHQTEDYSDDDDEYLACVQKVQQTESNVDRSVLYNAFNSSSSDSNHHKKAELNRNTTYEVKLTKKESLPDDKWNTKTLMRECAVCLLTKPEQEFSPACSENCQHHIQYVCSQCTYYSIQAVLNGAISNPVSCPESNCFVQLKSDNILSLLAIHNDHVLLKKYESYLKVRCLDIMDNYYWCVHGCGSGQFDDSKQTRNLKITCNECGQETCALHRVKWHVNMTCDQYDKVHPSIDKMTVKWMNQNSKKCPGCHCRIEKNGGCFHMICKKCQHQFCWDCLATYTPYALRRRRQHKIRCKNHPIGRILTRMHLLRSR